MVNTMEAAIDLVTGKLDICDLINNEDFLIDIDNSLRKLLENELYSDVQIVRKRQQIMKKLAELKEE